MGLSCIRFLPEARAARGSFSCPRLRQPEVPERGALAGGRGVQGFPCHPPLSVSSRALRAGLSSRIPFAEFPRIWFQFACTLLAQRFDLQCLEFARSFARGYDMPEA